MTEKLFRALIVGGGAREHALAWTLRRDPNFGEIDVAPGNAGTENIANNVAIGPTDIDGLLGHALKTRPDLTIVGPEAPLEAGIVDKFRAKALPILGPTQSAARVETSKAWAQQFLENAHVPVARGMVANNMVDVRYFLSKNRNMQRVVVKADGLADGKGVWIVDTADEAEDIAHKLLVGGILGPAGEKVVIQEKLVGQELSVMALTDGTSFQLFPLTRDHKRLKDDDQGPQTGGMGGFSLNIDPVVLRQIKNFIIEPTLDSLLETGNRF